MLIVGSSSLLVDMYAKSGSIDGGHFKVVEGCRVFYKMHSHSLVSWTAFFVGTGTQGIGILSTNATRK
jgi:hypothetical protein